MFYLDTSESCNDFLQKSNRHYVCYEGVSMKRLKSAIDYGVNSIKLYKLRYYSICVMVEP